ncbi:hypothetical protein BGZ96_002096 [Linnemannia gamsii]|uniref:Uncharacterized protein n=1 Tax=Linnemannia gamsii TaxID=64522 RepID=A0ABQ7JLG0_9FUNG|nr:hypothetical protein BGZ96_002096 [Linnemannia gamsii]
MVAAPMALLFGIRRWKFARLDPLQFTYWPLWTTNIMEGKNELEGRSNPMPMPDESNRAGVSQLKFLLLLVHLRKVLLQDAAALMELYPKDGVLYGHHHIFNLPVFKSPKFLTTALPAAIGDDQDFSAQAMLMSNQATPLKDPDNMQDYLDNTVYHLDNTEENEMEVIELETSSPEVLDAMDMDENLAQVTQDVVPRLPPMRIQSAPSSGPNLSLEEQLDLLAIEVAESRRIIEFDVSDGFTYEMISRSRPLGEHWEEWFYGLSRDGLQQP